MEAKRKQRVFSWLWSQRRSPWGLSIRRVFRWMRIAALLGVLGLLVFAIYLNQAGLPDFLKNPLLTTLRTQGVDLEFNRLRLRWYRGIVAEHVTFGRANLTSGPEFSVEEVEIGLDYHALFRRKLQVNALKLSDGRLVWHFRPVDRPAIPMALDRINAVVWFRPHDQWDIESVDARFRGLTFKIAGSITNASHLREIQAALSSGAVTNRTTERLDLTLSRVANALTNWEFSPSSELRLSFTGDAKQIHSLDANLQLTMPDLRSPWAKWTNIIGSISWNPPTQTNLLAETEFKLRAGVMELPWGRLTNTSIQALWKPALSTNDPSPVSIRVRCDEALTQYGQARRVQLSTVLPLLLPENMPPETVLECKAEAESVQTPQGEGKNIAVQASFSPALLQRKPANARAVVEIGQCKTYGVEGEQARLTWNMAPCPTNAAYASSRVAFSARQIKMAVVSVSMPQVEFTALHSLTNPLPAQAGGRVQAGRVQTRWGEAQTAEVLFEADRREMNGARSLPDFWAVLEPFSVHVEAKATQWQSTNWPCAEAKIVADWRAPELSVRQFEALLFDGRFAATGRVDVLTRRLTLAADSDVDLKKLVFVLPESIQASAAELTWEKPPKLKVAASLTLPQWTNRAPDWKAETLPTLELDSQISAGPMKIRQVPVTLLSTGISYSNATWRVSDFALVRDQERVDARLMGNERTKEFDFEVRGRLDPAAVLPFLSATIQKNFSLIGLNNAPEIEARAHGRWDQLDQIVAVGRAAVTNCSVRNEYIGEVRAGFSLTNMALSFTNVDLLRPGEWIHADLVKVDITEDLLFFTNAYGVVDPYALTRAIGPKVADIVAPYQFTIPPRAFAEGMIPMHGASADVRFDVDGGSFSWWRFRMPAIKGSVYWRGETVTVTNLQAECYQGSLNGWAFFDFEKAAQGADMILHMQITNMQCAPFMADISTAQNNSMEGWLTGELNITKGNTEDFKHWAGNGWVLLRDGLIWDIPVFGIFSPILNSVAPGLGSVRVSEGTSTMFITNSIVYTDDLEMRARALRMQYRGSVDFDYKVNARVEAEVLRDTWIIGPLISLALKPLTKLFEYKVTGTLDQPKMDPLYIPKILLAPLHPFRAIKSLFGGDTETAPIAPPPEAPQEKKAE